MLALFLIFIFIAIAIGLTWFFLSHDKGEKKPIGTLWTAAGLGFLGAILAMIIEGVFINADALKGGSVPAGTALVTALSVGLIEEACKFFPLAFYIYKKSFFNEHTDGIIYFALAGLGFGVPENILYTLSYGSGAGAARIILTPFFHAATTAMVGYFLIKAKLSGKSPLTAVWALIAAMVLHAIYDFGLLQTTSPIFIIFSFMTTVVLSVSIFLFFIRASETDQAEGRAATGPNNFCRHCGAPNPKHNLYCSHCGAHA